MHAFVNLGVSLSLVTLKSRRGVGLITSRLECSLRVSGPKCDPSEAESVCRFSSGVN